jgi:hypothetical protein
MTQGHQSSITPLTAGLAATWPAIAPFVSSLDLGTED